MAQDDYEPDATVWRAVTELEKQFYTKKEIAKALFDASVELMNESQANR